jgi:hypothetical protein
MSNQIQFTVPVTIAPLKFASVEKAGDVNDQTRTLALEIRVYGDNVVMHPTPFLLVIGDGECDALILNPNPGTILSSLMVVHRRAALAEGETGVEGVDYFPALAAAFTEMLTAYLIAVAGGGNGNNGILTKLSDLGLIPAGATT